MADHSTLCIYIYRDKNGRTYFYSIPLIYFDQNDHLIIIFGYRNKYTPVALNMKKRGIILLGVHMWLRNGRMIHGPRSRAPVRRHLEPSSIRGRTPGVRIAAVAATPPTRLLVRSDATYVQTCKVKNTVMFLFLSARGDRVSRASIAQLNWQRHWASYTPIDPPVCLSRTWRRRVSKFSQRRAWLMVHFFALLPAVARPPCRVVLSIACLVQLQALQHTRRVAVSCLSVLLSLSSHTPVGWPRAGAHPAAATSANSDAGPTWGRRDSCYVPHK
jgi:hypothetical protein